MFGDPTPSPATSAARVSPQNAGGLGLGLDSLNTGMMGGMGAVGGGDLMGFDDGGAAANVDIS